MDCMNIKATHTHTHSHTNCSRLKPTNKKCKQTGNQNSNCTGQLDSLLRAGEMGANALGVEQVLALVDYFFFTKRSPFFHRAALTPTAPLSFPSLLWNYDVPRESWQGAAAGWVPPEELLKTHAAFACCSSHVHSKKRGKWNHHTKKKIKIKMQRRTLEKKCGRAASAGHIFEKGTTWTKLNGWQNRARNVRQMDTGAAAGPRYRNQPPNHPATPIRPLHKTLRPMFSARKLNGA